ncbi:MAG: hypothetical protein ABI693_20860 [Bryobacteraceae bacterium]
MFNSIEDQIQKISDRPTSRVQQMLSVLAVIGVTAVLFGSLYVGISMLE